MNRRDGDRFPQSEFVEYQRIHVAALAIGLVGNQDHRNLLAAQNFGDFEVTRHHARLGVDYEERHVGLSQRRTRLLRDLFGHHRLAAQVDTAGVNETKRLAVPFHVDVLAVARDPGLGVHDGVAAPGQAVAERRLADVRIADHSDNPDDGLLRERLYFLVEFLASALARSRWLASAHALVSLLVHSGGTASLGRPARSALTANDSNWRR